ncbi:MAG: cell division protein FtsQ [Lachnospiraceae bacterium]|nr:cell division protein FtsQ [Lachnospiraceae bacterium]MEE1256859.1 cell division protein FtsQ [Lachnospiraceae bacterium]
MERKQTATQSQKLMIFVLTMSLYGLATLFTELIPKFQVGIVEFSVEYFLFIPLTLAILFDPLSTALGAAMGELVFSEIMLGQFGGLGELEKFITVTIGVYIAGKLVRNPKNKKIVGIAAMSGVVIQQVLGMIVDILKVQFAVEEFEAVPGLPESVIFTEGFSCLNDVVFSGVLFCLLPTLFLVPKLYGKIEPLLGMQPRTEKTMVETINAKAIIYSVLAFLGAISAEMLAENGFELIDWEAKWAESSSSFAIGMIVASVLAIVMLIIMKKKAESSVSKKEVA